MKIGLGYIPETSGMNDVIDTKISLKPFIDYIAGRLETERQGTATEEQTV